MWRCIINDKLPPRLLKQFRIHTFERRSYYVGKQLSANHTIPTNTTPHTTTHVYSTSNTNTVMENATPFSLLSPMLRKFKTTTITATPVNKITTITNTTNTINTINTITNMSATPRLQGILVHNPNAPHRHTTRTYLSPPRRRLAMVGTRFYTQHHSMKSDHKADYEPKIKVIQDRTIYSRIRKFFSFFKKFKPLTADHIFAIFSWAVFGTTFWVVVGTTTLLSVILWVINTLRFQEWVALRVGAYLSRQSGIHISFESAIGDWKQGTIRVQNVILAREGLIETGQSAIYLTIDRMDVNISLLWMLEGKGILRACKATGVRGFVDRRPEAFYMANQIAATSASASTATPVPSVPQGRVWKRGDFELEKLTISDLLIQLYLPDTTSTKPLPVSIYTMQCDRFRKQWLFLDILSAKSVVGKFDGCLFTFGIPQKEDITHIRTRSHLTLDRELKIAGVPMSLLSKTATGPLGWIKEGTLDISLIITLPLPESSAASHKTVANTSNDHRSSEVEVFVDSGQETVEGSDSNAAAVSRLDNNGGNTLDMQFDVMFNHLLVSAPLYTPELSYLNNAVIHPILAYMNSHSKHIPLSFDVRLHIHNLDGAWTPTEAGLWSAVSASVGVAFERVVHDTQTTETLRNVANTLLTDFWQWLAGWVYTPSYYSAPPPPAPNPFPAPIPVPITTTVASTSTTTTSSSLSSTSEPTAPAI